MASVWESRFAQYIRSVCGLRESTSLELLPDLMPVLPVVDPADAVQWLSRRERPFTQHQLVAAGGAGQFSIITLVNPANSGKVLVLEHASAKAGGVADFGFQVLTGGTSSASSASTRDTRNSATANGVGWLFARTIGGVSAATHFSWPLSATFQVIPTPPIVLGPNGIIDFYMLLANTSLEMNLCWRERAVDTAELAPTGA